MKQKRFKRHKDLIKQAVKNNQGRLTNEERLAKNILILSGIRNPSRELIREAMKNYEKENIKKAI